MSIIQTIKDLKQLSINSFIYYNYYKKSIDNNLIYVESRDGNDFTGNILRIVEELSKGNYGNYKIVVYAKKNVHNKIKELQKNYDLKIYKITSKASIATVVMERAKYIISDSGMRPKYVKRPGQIVLNTWHGTPLKRMGKYNEAEEHRCANIQQVFFACDYLLYPNKFMKEVMLESYMMEKIYPGKILLEGYPRNSVFFDENRRNELKDRLGFLNHEIYAYMPTFKGLLLDRKDDQQKDDVYNYLLEIDKELKDNQLLFVKLHVYNRETINFSEFKHIKEFPKGYETYDVLNIADKLITDYSSVLFDYANTKRKIILFNYDEEEYMFDRGTYFPLSDLPFPKVQNVDDLILELNSSKNYDDSEFIEKFCTYDNPNSVEKLCKHIFNNEHICNEEIIFNNKKNILIFGGGLLNNGLTSSLFNLLSGINTDDKNYFLSYRTWDSYIKENHRYIFDKIPEGIELCPLRTPNTPTLSEKRIFDNYRNSTNPDERYHKKIERMFEREYKRSFGEFKFDSIVQFVGYGDYQMLLFDKPEINNAIWVHNNMVSEIKTKDRNISIFKKVYNDYNTVSVVSPDLIEPTYEISGKRDNIKVIHNINNYQKVIDDAQKDIVFDENSEIISSESINDVLESDGKKFITIGRFSPEKGHDRLIKAFDKFCNDYPDTKLIIIGGYGTSYETTVDFAKNAKHSKNISIIKWIANPMPILNSCDLFILSSFYEGWPMVIMEADTLKVPVIATKVVGTKWMDDYNGYTVDNSEEGILKGMYDFMEGKINNNLKIDYEEYNKVAVKEFLDIIE